MSDKANRVKTKAEISCDEAFHHYSESLSKDPLLFKIRQKAFETVQKGFPDRRNESWHYTDVRRLLSQWPAFLIDKKEEGLEPIFPDSYVFSLINGVCKKNILSAPGLCVKSLSEHFSNRTYQNCMKQGEETDFIRSLNTAFVRDGYCFNIDDSFFLSSFLEIQNIQSESGQSHGRFCFRAAKKARTCVIERCVAKKDSFTSSVCDIFLEKDSHITWVVLQESHETASYLSSLHVTLAENSTFSLFVLTKGGKLVRQELRVRMEGQGAQFHLVGLNLLSHDRHIDCTTILDHAVADTFSRQFVRNVVIDKAQGVFQGRINVHQPAQKTDAKMSCATLLLSDDASFFAKPELEIFADDVTCGHGATVSDIDPAHLFYLMARGLDEKTARQMLVKAFLEEAIDHCGHEVVLPVLRSRLEEWLIKHTLS